MQFSGRSSLLQQPSDDESSPLKRRTLEDRVRTLESLIYEKDSTIYDLQRKLDQMTRVSGKEYRFTGVCPFLLFRTSPMLNSKSSPYNEIS